MYLSFFVCMYVFVGVANINLNYWPDKAHRKKILTVELC